MKYFLFVCCLLALSRVALADEAFPAFVTGQGATGSITGTELMPVIQGGVTTKDTLSGLKTYFQAGGGSVPNTTVLSPIVGDNAPQLIAALSGFSTVILSPGFYQVCSQVEVPGHKHLMGTDGVKQGIGNLNPTFHGPTWLATTGCSGSLGEGGFTAGQGFLHLHDGTTLSDFSIVGNWWTNNASILNCVNAKNAMSIVLDGMNIDGCKIGLDRQSTAVSGDSGSISQDAVVVHSSFNYMFQGILCGSDGGGNGCSDERYDSNEFEVTSFDIECDQCANSQFINNHLEDGGTAFAINGGQGLVINNNFMNRITAMTLDGTVKKNFMITFVGNKASGTDPGNVDHGVRFFATNQSLNITNNLIYNYIGAFGGGTNPNVDFIANSSIFNNRILGSPISENTHILGQVVHESPSTPTSSFDTVDPTLELYTTSASTYATFAANDPTGNGLAARVTEGAAGLGSVSHYITSSNSVTLTSGNTYTVQAYFAQGSSGTRNAGISEFSGSNGVTAIFNPSTCALVSQSNSGSGVIVGTPSAQSIGNGWCHAGVVFTGVGGATTPFLSLYSGSTAAYVGDSTSNLLFFNVDVLSGAVSPGTWIFANP